METKEIGFSDKLKSAVLIVEEVKALLITTPQEYALAGSKENAIRDMEKELEIEYKIHPVIIEAKNLQAMKSDLSRMLEDARKGVKSKRIAYDEAEERKRLEEQRNLQEAARKMADEEKLKAALAAEQSGNKNAAEAIIQQEVIVPTVIIPRDTPKAGAPPSTRWFFVVDDAFKIPNEYWDVSQSRLDAVARANHERTNIPGGHAAFKKV